MASSLSTSGLALDSICAVLYTLLACGALLRLVQRHRQSGCPFRFFSSHARSGACFQRLAQCWTRTNVSCCCCSDPTDEFRQRTSHGGYSTLHSSASGGSSSSNSSNGAKKGYLVMLALLVYCVMRATQLALFAAGVLDSSGDITTNMYRFVPALGFMAVQATMLYKWIDHVSELTLVLQHQAFGIGQFLMTCSVLLMLSDAVLTILALIDTQIVHFSHQPGHMWNVLVNMFCGVVYAFNGIAFSGLGCFLRYLWIPVTPMGAYASKRILGIALIFGVMCVGRGAILLMYIGDDSSDVNTHVHTVTHNDWGAPAVLLFEWTALVISLFLLTVAKHHNNNSSASNSMTAATIQPAVAFSSGGGGEAPLTEESGDAVAHSFRGDASSQFYIGGGTGRSTMSSSTTAGDHNNRATAVYHPRYSIGTASSEVSLATIGSNPNSSSSARATVGAPLPPRSTVVTSSSPFTSSSRSHHSMTHQQNLRRSVDAAGLRVAMMRGGGGGPAPLSSHSQQQQQHYYGGNSGGGALSSSSLTPHSRRAGGLHATAAVVVDDAEDEDDAIVDGTGECSSSVPYSSQRSEGGGGGGGDGGGSFFFGGGGAISSGRQPRDGVERPSATGGGASSSSPPTTDSVAVFHQQSTPKQPEETIQGGSQRSLP